MEYPILVLLHVLLAIIIIGGILITSFIVIPYARKTNAPDFAFQFIKAFNRGSHAALTIQFLIGFRLAMNYLPIGEWFGFANSVSASIVIKLTLWVLLFAINIISTRKIKLAAESGDISVPTLWFGILSVIALALMVTGLNFKLSLF
jgi:uncharacterized membrane protein